MNLLIHKEGELFTEESPNLALNMLTGLLNMLFPWLYGCTLKLCHVNEG